MPEPAFERERAGAKLSSSGTKSGPADSGIAGRIRTANPHLGQGRDWPMSWIGARIRALQDAQPMEIEFMQVSRAGAGASAVLGRRGRDSCSPDAAAVAQA